MRGDFPAAIGQQNRCGVDMFTGLNRVSHRLIKIGQFADKPMPVLPRHFGQIATKPFTGFGV